MHDQDSVNEIELKRCYFRLMIRHFVTKSTSLCLLVGQAGTTRQHDLSLLCRVQGFLSSFLFLSFLSFKTWYLPIYNH